jgi:DNA-binding transcriptional MerR regulator
MRIGDAAKRVGIQASAIRYYERVGLLPAPLRIGGRRSYDDSILDLLTLVVFARHVGFSMREVRALFGNDVAGKRISKRWRALAQRKIAAIDQQVEHLHMARELLRRVSACRCVEPAECGRQIRRFAAS